jgi:hypothetical protein
MFNKKCILMKYDMVRKLQEELEKQNTIISRSVIRTEMGRKL